MRVKILVPVLFLAGLALAARFWVRQGAAPPPPASAVLGPAETAALPQPTPAPASPQPKAVSAQTAPGAAPAAVGLSADSSQAREQAYVEARVAQLQDLASDDTPASLDTICSELTNRDPRIRQAARESAMQFGSREAIPRLQAALGQTDDPQEKIALQEAIEFLKLPSPSELATSAAGPHTAPKASPRAQ